MDPGLDKRSISHSIGGQGVLLVQSGYAMTDCGVVRGNISPVWERLTCLISCLILVLVLGTGLLAGGDLYPRSPGNVNRFSCSRL